VGQVLTAANRNGRTDVPAHRVVNRQGLLTGKAHFPPPGMAERLRREGVAVADDRVLDFAGHFWDPRQALGEEAGA